MSGLWESTAVLRKKWGYRLLVILLKIGYVLVFESIVYDSCGLHEGQYISSSKYVNNSIHPAKDFCFVLFWALGIGSMLSAFNVCIICLGIDLSS